MKFTKIPEDTFKNLQMNAGILVRNFNPETLEIEGLMGATSGGVQFNAQPTFEDFGSDIDNCPKNTLELKKLTEWAVSLSGTFITVTLDTGRTLVGAADIVGNKIVPRNDVYESEFEDIWWVGDYSNVNDGNNAGYCAIHMLNALNTGGFQITSSDKGKGQFAFNFEGHYSMNAQDTVPFEVYIQNGGESAVGSILFNQHTISLEAGDTATIKATTFPEDAEITWTTGSSSVADVSDGVVTAEGEGNTIIKGSITYNGVTYDDTCTIIVTEAEG